MDKNVGVLCIGGDKRHCIAENYLYDLGFDTALCLNDHLESAKGATYENWHQALSERNIIVFPLPITQQHLFLNAPCGDQQPITLLEIFQYIQPNSLILGGKIPSEISFWLDEKGIKYVDYYNEELQIANALPTAEGALGIALCEMPITLSGANVLVVGYGRIAKVLADKLRLLGSRVTVAARKSTDLVTAMTYGYDTLCIQNGIPVIKEPIDVIFNTVPACLFGRKELAYFNENTLYIELASAPYGIDTKEAARRKIRVIMAQSLPGKYSPVTAGKILAETVVRILQKEDQLP